MIEQGFHIGERDWWVMVYYNIQSERELNDAYRALLASGCDADEAQKACMVLSGINSGYTFTDFGEHVTLMFIGKADSAEEFYDTCQHEVKHAVEHISEYYKVDSRSEEAAYLQGEISRKMFPAVAMAVCPICHE
jgi:hypothetical protein